MNSNNAFQDAPFLCSDKTSTSPKQDPKMIDRIPSLVSLSTAASDATSDATSDCDESEQQTVSRGGVVTPFPWKLHDMLETIEEDGYGDVVSWQPHGRCFVVHNPTKFVQTVMPLYFNQTKFASFQRQLNLYGFSRLTTGRDKGGYYHESFLRGKRHLCQNMVRLKVKGTKVRRALEPALEPQFYSMPFMPTKGSTGEEGLLPSTATARRLLQTKPPVVCFFEGKPFHFFDESMVIEPNKCDDSSLKRENTVIQTWMSSI